ncbi:hypothetical protein [Micromonospora violae]|uniref:hypothetical protein n=1 Tax=Micromonospora violae TaxID=1278207 RepID=UPI0034061A7B
MMKVSDWTALVGLALTMVGIGVAVWTTLRGRSVRSYLKTRERVRKHQAQLSADAWNRADSAWKRHDVPMLTSDGWILPNPVGLDRVRLRWLDAPITADRSAANAARASRLLPRDPDGGRRLRYSKSLVRLDHMDHLFNGAVYRPVSITPDRGGLVLDFQAGHYFDYLDTSEVLAYESATGRHRYRNALKDPFDLRARSASLGVLTLTIRRGPDTAGFFMHARDGGQVVVGSEVMHVIPAGEFAPSDRTYESLRHDFDIWLTIMREYAEEFLNMEEAYGQGGEWLDYYNKFPYRQLNEARDDGRLTVQVLGLGLDPLTWKPELLTVCIIDAEVFDAVFKNMVRKGPEGTLVVGREGQGLPFDQETVNLYANHVNTRRGASSCLNLAWRHRKLLRLSRT